MGYLIDWFNDCKLLPLKFWTKVVGHVEKKGTLQESARREGMSLHLVKEVCHNYFHNLRHYHVNLLQSTVAM